MPRRNGEVCVGIFGSPVICILMNVNVHFRFVIFVVVFITTLSGVGIPVGARFSALVQTDLGAHPAYRRYRVSFGGWGGKFAAPWR